MPILFHRVVQKVIYDYQQALIKDVQLDNAIW